jgi:hypothetical protein
MLMTASLLTRMPISVREWRMRLTDLCHRSAMAEAQDEGTMLRMGYHLLSRLPDKDSLLADHLPPEARFDTWLAAGTHDSAALALIPETGSFLLSRNGDGTCLASVMLPGLDEEMTSEGTTPALALVSWPRRWPRWMCMGRLAMRRPPTRSMWRARNCGVPPRALPCTEPSRPDPTQADSTKRRMIHPPLCR